MERIDITRELLTAPALSRRSPAAAGSPQPHRIGRCLQHLAAPHLPAYGHPSGCARHFFPDGADTEQALLEACVGDCTVVAFDGLLLGAQAEQLLGRVRRRVLFKGKMEISPSAAFVLSDAGIRLVGVEGPSVSPAECETAVHRQLLGSGMALLEGLDLSAVEPGGYFLFAAPLKIRDGDGSPVRAVLVRE